MNIKQIQQMMKQAQQMQGNMEKVQSEIEAKEFTAAAGGVVDVVMTGDKLIKSINIKEEVIDVEEKEMLEDLVKAAINQCVDEIDNYTKEKMGPLTQGLPF